jgi:predicted enzyme related to lactoylglutathione lyase
MFGKTHAFSSFSVSDIPAAKDFYGKTLGVEVDEMEGMGLNLKFPNGGRVFVYPKDDHSPATFTVLNFPVEDLEQAVDQLAGKGIKFEQYEGTDAKGINRGDEGPAIAWFKDPFGNFLSVLEGEMGS